MSITDAVARVDELQTLAQRAVAPAQPLPQSAAFAGALGTATGVIPANRLPDGIGYLPQPVPLAPAAPFAGGDAAAALLQAAESQVGQAEEPPGSNDGPQLGVYRSAVAGAASGEPWCAYFASWCAAQAGTPLGDAGQGLGSVAQITDWASRTGRLLPASAPPAPGDLMLFGDRHVGVVESVNPDGSLTTVEGNYANAVSRVHRSPSEATGYVRVG